MYAHMLQLNKSHQHSERWRLENGTRKHRSGHQLK
jgi:hypothetical protein